MQIRTLLVPCALALALVPPADEVSFHPDEGKSITKSFDTAMTMDLDELSLVVDGQDMGAMMGDMSLHMEIDTSYTVTDEYMSVAGSRPSKLQRTYDDLSMEQEFSVEVAAAGMSQTESSSASSDLEGSSVVFTWSDDSEEYDVQFANEGGDEALLEGLEEDMDLRGFLPEGEVSEGDSWKLSNEVVAVLAAPGGDLKMIPDDMDVADMEEFAEMIEEIQGQFGEMFEEAVEGESTATYIGTRDVDGTAVGVIQIEIEVTMNADLSELIYEVIDKISESEGAPEDLDINLDAAELDMEYTGSGELLWDLRGGHAHSLDVSGDFDLSFDLAVEVDAQGEAHSLEAFIAMTGSAKNTVTIE